MIAPAPQELAAGRLCQTSLERATTAIHREGYLIVENAVAGAHLDLLRVRAEEDSQVVIAKNARDGINVRKRFVQGLPPFAPYVFGDIVASPFVAQITRHVLGPGSYNNLYSCNTNCPGSDGQPVHADAGQLWPNLRQGHPPATLVVNIPLKDVTEEDGSIQIWPGTHLETDISPLLDIDARRVQERSERSPPIRINTKKGGVLIRDIRLWHRGMPNLSASIRHMITMNHNVFWLERGRALKFQKGCEEAFVCTHLKWHIEFTDEPLDYIGR